MKHLLFNLVATGFALFLCSCHYSEKPETILLRDFNLGAIVEKMNVVQLHPQTGGGGMSTSIGQTTERRRDFHLQYRLEEPESGRFDEATFLEQLKVKVAEKIIDSDVRTNGAGSSNDNFYFSYSKEENKGSIEVIGSRAEENQYKLWCVIHESAGVKSND